MELKTVYLLDYDVLRGVKDNLYRDIYETIPLCFKEKKYESYDIESIPKEKEIIIMKARKGNSLMVMSVFKVVYYEWKIFVVVKIMEGSLQSIEKESTEVVPNLLQLIR